MAKDEMVVRLEAGTPTINWNGKTYRAVKFRRKKGDIHSERLIFRPVDEEKYAKRVATVAEYLRKNTAKLSTQRILEEALKIIPVKDFDKIEKLCRKRKKPVLRSGCLAIDIGKDFVQIV